jgi:3-deoxy-D-manno-octulosonate 8-phosphate phosphatase (KDO 8-P phosphatase)
VNAWIRRQLPSGVRLAAFDVDGVFTDGRFYLSNDGVESKAFSTQDGFGIKRLLAADIHVAVISSRKSRAVAARMSELGVRHVIQGAADKVAAFESIVALLQLSVEDCVYVGDDVPDLPVLKRAGFAIAVANAVNEVKEQCDFTTRAAGGYGAVREVCDLLLSASTPGRPGA